MLQQHCEPGDAVPDCPGITAIAKGPQTLVLIASVPLTDGAWRPLSEGELVAVRGGEVLSTALAVVA